MKRLFTHVSQLLLLALACSTSLSGWGQTYTPVALTGFTHDIIANGTGAVSATTTADIDGAATTGGTGYCLMAQDYVGPNGQVPNSTAYPAATYPALQNNGLITSGLNSSITYQLASYSANNALRLYGAAATGTLSFTTPSPAAELYIIGTSGNAASVLSITVNFADGTTQVFANQSIADWFAANQTNVVRERLGRVSRADNTVQYTGSPVGPRFYQLKLVLGAANVAKNITGVTFAKAAAAGTTVLLALTKATYPTCTAVPSTIAAAATTTSGGTTALTTACASTSIYLSVSGLGVQTGYTYQWQSSTNGTTWANISGATDAIYTATGQTATTSYRVQVGCASAGGALTASAPVQITQSPLLNCYCTPTYLQGGINDIITNVTLGSLTNSTTGNASPYYRDYSAQQTGTGATLAVPNLAAGATANVTLTFGSDGNQYSGVWVDFNANGTFETTEYFSLGTNAGANGTASIPLVVPATATLGLTKLRVRGGDDAALTSAQACGASASSYGEAEDYLVNVVAATACSGTPPAITAVASATTACAATSFTLSATGVATGTTGLTYQWQSKLATASTFANISGATAATYTVTGQAAATDYRLVVTCTASSQSATSNTVAVAQSPLANCYCTVVSTGTNEYIKGVTLPGAPGFTNTTGANSTNGYGNFTANAAYTTTLARGTTYNSVSVTVRSNNVGSQGGLWIDYDQNGTFDASEYTLVGSTSLVGADVTFPVTLAVPATALAGPTRLRVRWRNSSFTSADACVSGATAWYGETEDYLVTISATPLASTPAASAAKLALFPNPAQSVATLTGATAAAPVQVLDVLGRVLLTAQADATGKAVLLLPTDLAKGVYLVRVGQLTTRLVLE